MNVLNLKVAVSLVNAALVAGRKINAAPLTVAVLDAGGHLLALQREDGASLIRPEVATGKAWGAIALGKQVMGAWDFHTPGRKEHRATCLLGHELVIQVHLKQVTP